MNFFKKDKKVKDKKGGNIKNPKILEVNLIKEEVQLEFNWRQNLKILIFALTITIFIIIEIYLGLDWWQQDEATRLTSLKEEAKKISQEVEKMQAEAKDALAYQNKTEAAAYLLDKHIYWTNFFSWLEKNTLSTVSYNGFSGNIEEEYFLTGTAGSFAEVSWQANKILSAPFVANVEILNARNGEKISREDLEKEAQEALANQEAANEENIEQEPKLPPGVSFELTLELEKEIFEK